MYFTYIIQREIKTYVTEDALKHGWIGSARGGEGHDRVTTLTAHLWSQPSTCPYLSLVLKEGDRVVYLSCSSLSYNFCSYSKDTLHLDVLRILNASKPAEAKTTMTVKPGGVAKSRQEKANALARTEKFVKTSEEDDTLVNKYVYVLLSFL